MTYLNVDEVESALIALAAAHPALCELITLPEKTAEGRTTHALRIGTKPAGQVPVYYLTGAVHAREWGSSDILVNLATDLLDAYAANVTLSYGNKTFSAAEIAALVEQTNLLIFPCVNPDGRAYSMASTHPGDAQDMWRRNRNPAQSGGNPDHIGVDINRNQDFLWDFATAFAPQAVNIYLASNSTADETYHGPAATSEVETRNIRHLHDVYGPAWYVDLHSWSEDILYAWGDDESQSADPGQAFTNSNYDGQRGLIGGPYAEYMPDGDRANARDLAQAFTEVLGEVRGKTYVAKPSFSLYATSGTNTDYAYGRHIVDPGKAKTLAFTVEWGTEFQPDWPEMALIVADVCAGLIGLGLKAIGIDGYIVSNRDTFSSYEVDTIQQFPAAFYAIYDGFSPDALDGTPAVAFIDTNGGTIGSIKGTVSATELELPGDTSVPQRVTFTIDATFTDGSAFTSETRDIFVRTTLAGIVCVAPLHLVKQPNPYILDGPVNWLSTDLRVFQLRPGEAIAHSAVTLADPNNDANAPIDYIQALLGELRGLGNAPAAAFDTLSQSEEASRLELARTVNGKRVFNFALAKVRYRAATQDATDVRVFFRMFNAMVSDLSYSQSSTSTQNYRRTADGKIPLLGINKFFSGGAGSEIVSIPFFASGRVNSATTSMTQQTDDHNRWTVQHAGATEAVAYFGCWLDFNQTEPQLPPLYQNSDGPFANRLPILQLVRGTHQCLVAEIRFQPGTTDPIAPGATPGSSDRLAQRNLAIVESDNPGDPSTHVVQHTLLVKPSGGATIGKTLATAAVPAMPDELVLRFGALPAGTNASLYFPDFTADEIIALATTMRGGPQRLTRADAHTVSCDASAIIYVPLPPRPGPLAPGLLTLRLPDSVRTGEVFHADVAQHSGPVLPAQRPPGVAGAAGRVAVRPGLSRRKVLGAFRMTTLVSAGTPLIARATRELGVLKYIREAIPAADSWRPVFDRYIAQLSGQVAGLGGNPDVPPSPDDPETAGGAVRGRDRIARRGKVREVVFDCFGDFGGFVLADCTRLHRLHSTEPRIGRLALCAYQEGWPVTVWLDRDTARILEVIVGRGDD